MEETTQELVKILVGGAITLVAIVGLFLHEKWKKDKEQEDSPSHFVSLTET